MKEQTYFHIPTPCHEDWNNMTPEGKGRFCASCSKQVVDFSLMSDQQVLNYFKNTTGSVCGRFANDQLQRPMTEVAEQKKKTWWFALMMPLLLLFDKTNAQTKGKVKSVKYHTVSTETETIFNGLVTSSVKPPTGETIIGNVKDKYGIPVPFATVSIENSRKYTTTDTLGNFELFVGSLRDSVKISISSIGYEAAEQLVKRGTYDVSIILKQKTYDLNPVACVTALTGTMGGITMVRSITVRERIDTVIRKTFRNTAFKIFPNPVERNSKVKLEINNTGEYSIQILDNNSTPIFIKDIAVNNKKSIEEINIPQVAAGVYYIRLVDKNKKKQYTDKLIVQ